jgi:hypothetical protein
MGDAVFVTSDLETCQIRRLCMPGANGDRLRRAALDRSCRSRVTAFDPLQPVATGDNHLGVGGTGPSKMATEVWLLRELEPVSRCSCVTAI